MAKATKSKTTRGKTPAKRAAKKVAPKMKARAKAVAKSEPQGGFMWRLLKKKEAERKLKQEQNRNSQFDMHRTENPFPNPQGFTRFNGPRRKAA